MSETPERRWPRYALATILGGSILAMTYVLFDPDLGTSSPLFQEITCRGDIEVTLTSGFFEPFLRIPDSGIYFRGSSEGKLVPVFARVELRENGLAWSQLTAHEVPSGEEYFYLSAVTEQTEARVLMKSLDGSVCEGISDIIRGKPGPYADVAQPTPPLS